MGGPDSELWHEYRHLLLKGLMAARKHMDRVINLVEIMRSSKYFFYNFLKNYQVHYTFLHFKVLSYHVLRMVVLEL